MKSQADFEAFCRTDLQAALTELEAKRARIVRTLSGVFAAALVLLGAAALILGGAILTPPALIIAGVILIGGGAIVWNLTTRGFVLEFKQRIIAAIVRFYDPSLTYEPRRCITQARFCESGLFQQRIDRYRGEDYVAGRVEATALEFSELHAEHMTVTHDSKGRRQTQWHTIFKGLFFVADFNKEFHGQTVVLPDTAQRMLGFLGQKLQELNLTRGELIKLEDPEFEREFVVYGTDQVEARYILSTSLMRRILEYKRKTGKPMHLSFAHSNVYVALTTGRDMFEPHIFRPIGGPGGVREHLDDLEIALGIVEELNLNTRIWTK